ncbi:MAG: Na+/H+ antiporter NhaA [Sphingomonadales bacterium]|nr:Na+/H+ antiporter NhaA [Sphingomonadales bacterium]
MIAPGNRRHHTANRLARAILRRCHGEAGAGLLLMAVAAVAMVAANSPWAHRWHDLWHHPLPWTPLAALPTAAHWIDDALMAVFFFTVGLEIKREALAGDLAHPRLRRLPVLAAALGMAAPALVYLALTHGHPGLARGWAIPAATDIAFALGVLGLAGTGLPASLRLLLLGIAVVDDLGAVAIIALCYGSDLHIAWLAAAAAPLAALVALNRAGCARAWPYLGGALLLWFCVLHSGIHATVAGVLAALTVPLRPRSPGDSLLLRIEHALAPWCSYAIVPLFGLASAGVPLAAGSFGVLAFAVGAGLVLGKQGGVLGAVWLARRTGIASMPANGLALWGVSLLAGIGFTMSLFIANLAFPGDPHLADQARLGILGGSLVSALTGYAVLRIASRRLP